jgi:branched-chain amino acid transport system substrate-binding protein
MLTASTAKYESIAKDYAERLLFARYSISAVERMTETFTDRRLISFTLLILGKKEMLRGRIDEGKSKFYNIIQSYADMPEYDEAVELYNKESIYVADSGTERYVAVMLPLGEDIDFSSLKPAHQVLRGIKFAFHRYNKTHTNQIGLIVENTQRNEQVINDIAANLKQLPGIYAVIGALFSDETEWTARAFEKYDIPVVSPTATENALQQVCNNCFQANPTFDMRGRLMAQYAYYKDNRRTMAVVYSPGGYSSDLKDGFTGEFSSLGGRIVELIAYPFGADDLTEITSSLVQYKSTLDGIYLPISDMKVGIKLLNALRNNGISVPLYGNQDWFSVKNLHLVPSLSNQLTFSSDYYLDFEDPVYQDARDDFKELTNLELNRYHLYGYDLANLILDAVASAPFGSDSFSATLRAGSHENGIHNKITFSGTNVNKYINILRYHNGKYEFVETFRYRE